MFKKALSVAQTAAFLFHKGLKTSKKLGATTIAFTGNEVNALQPVTDYIIDIPKSKSSLNEKQQ